MKVVAFGDTHFPFCNQKKLPIVYKHIEREKPDAIVHLGDLYDNYMFSRFDKDYNVIKPKDEMGNARAQAITMWAKIENISKNSKKFQLFGNHDIRVAKAIMRMLPVLAGEIKTLREKYYTFHNVEVMHSDREFVTLDGVVYVHGWHNSNVMHMRHFGKCVVHGHSHKPDLIQEPLAKTGFIPRWEVDAGCLADQKRVPFDYTSSIQTNWKSALAVITDGKPELFII